jgi:hypothetical protein
MGSGSPVTGRFYPSPGAGATPLTRARSEVN